MNKVLVARQLPLPYVSNSLFPFNPSLEDEIKRLFANFTIDKATFAWRNVPNTRRKKSKKPMPMECVFCKNNGEEATYYRKHCLKDTEGRVVCPVLRAYTCPICGANGDTAHTIKYCPANNNPEPVATVNALKVLRNATGRRRSK